MDYYHDQTYQINASLIIYTSCLSSLPISYDIKLSGIEHNKNLKSLITKNSGNHSQTLAVRERAMCVGPSLIFKDFRALTVRCLI